MFVEYGDYDGKRYDYEGQHQVVKIQGLPGLFLEIGSSKGNEVLERISAGEVDGRA